MNFELTEEQHSLADSVRGVLARDATPGVLRALWTTETGRDKQLWAALVDIGLPAIVIPEEYGGLGGGLLDLVLVLEQVGRTALPDAIIENCLLAPILIGSCADATVREAWLPRIVEGARVTVTRPGTRIAPDAIASDAVIIIETQRADLVERGDVDLEPLVSMDPSSRLCEVVDWETGRELVGADLKRAESDRAIAVAAVLGGVAERLIELTTDYVKIRHQFGRPIGSFQAVKHQLAQAESLRRVARWAILAAADRVAAGHIDGPDAATLAMLCASDAERECNRVALQLHGGIGFTWEHDLQLWLKFGKTLEMSHWSGRDLALRAGELAIAAPAGRAV